MNRRTLGRGRWLAGIGAVVALAGCLLPWGRTLGLGLPPETTGAFDGSGILVFLAAVAVLALVALPYAAGDQPIGIDRPISFALALALGAVGLVFRLVQLVQLEVVGLPDRSPGLWLAGAGLLVMAWGVAELFGERASA
ncbi:MAG TPA: hypothetical protein VFK38_00720 [Candidatus Limnocylindrales bacterium]|nr:hypothetical protein [Candidatus Limnocylindrales bacterium]